MSESGLTYSAVALNPASSHHADVDGKLDDTVYSRKPTALDGAVVRGSETLALPENFQPVSADDSIHVFPKLFVRKVSCTELQATLSSHASACQCICADACKQAWL